MNDLANVTTGALQISTSFSLAAPQQAMQVAEILQRFVTEKKLTANIKGKNYPLVEAWQFAGSQLGLYPLLTETKDLSNPNETKYMATVEVRRIDTDALLSRGVAVCSNKEASKRLFDEYAILSMAQTRAEGKAYRMLLSWLMKAAGFEATPAEEMDFVIEKDPGKVTSFNHKPIVEDNKPIIPNEIFKSLCEEIRSGNLEMIKSFKEEYSFEETQKQIINNLVKQKK
jgi:hypothetical protein